MFHVTVRSTGPLRDILPGGNEDQYGSP